MGKQARLGAAEAAPTVVAAMRTHRDVAEVADRGCYAVVWLACNHPENQVRNLRGTITWEVEASAVEVCDAGQGRRCACHLVVALSSYYTFV